MVIQATPALVEQVYQLIHDEICSGEFAPGTPLVQEQLAAKLGVSRQPIQQAIALLKSDGLVEEAGKRGVRVSMLNVDVMQHQYEVRGLLDGFAASKAAAAAKADVAIAASFKTAFEAMAKAAQTAIEDQNVSQLIRLDEGFHRLVYATSGNPIIETTAESQWRFLRRIMGEVIRKAEQPAHVWDQHADIAQAIISGNAKLAEKRMADHVDRASRRLSASLLGKGSAV